MEASYDPRERLASARKEFGEWGGVNASIEVSTTFTVLDASTMPAMFAGEKTPENGSCYVYGRSYNPTVRYLGRQLAALEDTEAAYACSSGIAAISSTLLALCNSGDHVVASNAVYGGTFALLDRFLPAKCATHTTFVNIADLAAVEAAITPNTKVLYTETVSNPTLVIADIPGLAAISRARGIQLVVDNTFTPLVLTPSRLGANIVVHSLTKFISGASDIIGGAVCGPAAFITQLMDLNMGPMMLLGPTMDPKIASELSLRIPHLPARMEVHCQRAAAYAERLHALGAKVVYPGLPSHPQYHLMSQLKNPGYGFGGILGIDMGSQRKAEQLMERLQNVHSFGLMAVSLGYFETLMSCSGASTSSELSEEDKSKAGIRDGYVRVSAGITGTLDQRWSQLQEAYCNVAEAGGAALMPNPKLPGSFQLRSLSPGSETSSDDTDYSDPPLTAAVTTANETSETITGAVADNSPTLPPKQPALPSLLHVTASTAPHPIPPSRLSSSRVEARGLGGASGLGSGSDSAASPSELAGGSGGEPPAKRSRF